MTKRRTIGVMLMAFSSHRQKVATAWRPNRTPSNGLEMANQKETRHPDSSAVGFVFTLFSQAFEDRHFTWREISFGTLNELRRTWIVASGLENSAKTAPGTIASRFSRRQRKPPISSKQNCDTFRFVSFETKPLRCPRSRLKAGSPRSATGRTTRAGPLSNRPSRWHGSPRIADLDEARPPRRNGARARE
jgi:hypothetical protein